MQTLHNLAILRLELRLTRPLMPPLPTLITHLLPTPTNHLPLPLFFHNIPLTAHRRTPPQIRIPRQHLIHFVLLVQSVLFTVDTRLDLSLGERFTAGLHHAGYGLDLVVADLGG